MKAVEINKYGGPEVLKIVDTEIPPVGNDEILIKIKASSINPVDWKVRKGVLRFIPGQKLPKRLGADLAGIVEQVGKNITEYNNGDEVYGVISAIRGGAYAEYVIAKKEQIAIKPSILSMEEAAAIPLAALTAYQALNKLGEIKEGDLVCINGSSGGVGHFAVQIAKALGAKVVGVCSAKNVQFSKELGADVVIDYNTTNILETSRKFDIFFDAVANQSFLKVLSILKKDGIYITTLPSFPNIISPIIKLFNGKRSKLINLKSNSKDLRFLSELGKSGKLHVNIEKTYNLKNIQEAHRHSETRRVVGKLAISINGE